MTFALLQGLGAPERATVIFVFLIAIVGSVAAIGFAWGRRKRDKKRYCPKCNRELNQPESAPRCAYCGERLF
jgi:hypothetical protein